MSEELWQQLGHDRTLAYEPWPEFNEEYLKEDTVDYPVSFNGKTRFSITLPVNYTREEITEAVLTDDRAKKWIGTSVT